MAMLYAFEFVAFRLFITQLFLMKIVSVRDFTSRFATLSHSQLKVRRRGKILGTWIPDSKAPEPLDVMKRLREEFQEPLPFTFADLLKEGKRR